MQTLTPAEQMLLAALALAERSERAPSTSTAITDIHAFGPFYFGMYCQDWTGVPSLLQKQELAVVQDEQLSLTEKGIAQARRLKAAHPRPLYAYNEFFYRARRSAAHARFCERVYGRDLCQHGMADMTQIDALAQALREQPAEDVLELGCGNGAAAAYLARLTGAKVTGVEFAEEGIDWAQEYAAQMPGCLTFLSADMTTVEFPAESFDAILLVDTIYFVGDLPGFTRRLLTWLRPGGRLYVFASAWAGQTEPRDALEPDATPFARALQALELPYQTTDYSAAEAEHWQHKLRVAAEIQSAFEAEGQDWLFRRRWGEADSLRPCVEDGCVRRYLYVVGR